MLARRLQLHEVDDVDHPDLHLGRVLSEDLDGRERLERRHVAAARHHHVGIAPLSLLAHSQMPMPAVQCSIACSMPSHTGAGCFPATTTFT